MGRNEFSYDAMHFTARGVTANPKPSHVPIWIGGNSPLTRRRVAKYGDGWNPFPATPLLAQTARTIPLEGLDDLAPMLDHLWEEVDKAGRDRGEIDVAFVTGLPSASSSQFDAGAHLGALDRMAAIGVTWSSTGVPGDSLDHAIETIERYGAEVISMT